MPLIPAKAGISGSEHNAWSLEIPAYAGMSGVEFQGITELVIPLGLTRSEPGIHGAMVKCRPFMP